MESSSKGANTGLSSYEIMSNSHTYYQVGIKKDSSETFYGFVRDLKVFKRLLTADEISQEAGRLPYWSEERIGPALHKSIRIFAKSTFSCLQSYDQVNFLAYV